MPRLLISTCRFRERGPDLEYDPTSAIMKYHSLKMEEVNDIMHHLWNKTYQGTGKFKPNTTAYLLTFCRYRWHQDQIRR
jgi:hypothetical protein